MNKDKVGAIFFLVISIAYGMDAMEIPLTFMDIGVPFTPRTMPVALAVLGTIVSFLILILPVSVMGEKTTLGATFRGLDWKRVSYLVVLMVLYGLTIKRIGFILSTILFLIGGFLVLGERRVMVILLSSIPLVVAFWYILTHWLGIYLSPGDLFEMFGGAL